MAAAYTAPHTTGCFSVLAHAINDPNTPEGRVNGLWNQILNTYFPPSDYAIQPEVLQGGGGANAGRPDLLVVKQEFQPFGWRLVLPYEGKRGVGRLPTDVEWDAVRSQVFRYWAPRPHAQSRAAVAIGRYCKFYGYDVGAGDILELKKQRDGKWEPQQGVRPPFDVEHDAAVVADAMQYIQMTSP